MNQLLATICQIEESGRLHLVRLDLAGERLWMVTLELARGVVEGSQVRLAVNSSHIAIVKGSIGALSHANQLPATIIELEVGLLLSRVRMRLASGLMFESLLTQRSVEAMELVVGDQVRLCIDACELSIVEVLGC